MPAELGPPYVSFTVCSEGKYTRRRSSFHSSVLESGVDLDLVARAVYSVRPSSPVCISIDVVQEG